MAKGPAVCWDGGHKRWRWWVSTYLLTGTLENQEITVVLKIFLSLSEGQLFFLGKQLKLIYLYTGAFSYFGDNVFG